MYMKIYIYFINRLLSYNIYFMLLDTGQLRIDYALVSISKGLKNAQSFHEKNLRNIEELSEINMSKVLKNVHNLYNGSYVPS